MVKKTKTKMSIKSQIYAVFALNLEKITPDKKKVYMGTAFSVTNIRYDLEFEVHENIHCVSLVTKRVGKKYVE